MDYLQLLTEKQFTVHVSSNKRSGFLLWGHVITLKKKKKSKILCTVSIGKVKVF